MELNSNQIQEINPHRYPFALVDRITDYEPGEYANSGQKELNVSVLMKCIFVDIFQVIMSCQEF